MRRRFLSLVFSALVTGIVVGFSIGIFWYGTKIEAATATQFGYVDTPQVTTTIEDILAEPGNYSGKRVSLAGQLTECAGWECSLCPDHMTTKTRDPRKCLPVSFRSFIPDTGFGSREQEKVLRFSNVVLRARFDPSCLTPGNGLDRQVVLFDAEATSVGERRSSRSGLWLGNYSPLKEVGKPFAGALRAAALDAGFPDNPPFKAFETISDNPRVVVCWTPPIEPTSWPNTLEGALYAPSTKDFYDCRAAREVAGRWVIQAVN